MVVLLLLGLAVASVAALRPPESRPVDAPAAEFSADRAAENVQWIAAEPHPTGSEAAGRVVDRLAATLAALGLDTRVQNAVGTGPEDGSGVEMARVRNVVAVLPGTDSTGRLLLVAQHDSAANGPGAVGATGAAALLESVRALTAGPPLRNDVVVVLLDAEEPCRCGAQAFLASNALAQGGGVVLHLDARGTTGPILLGSSPGGAALTAVAAQVAPHPLTSGSAVGLDRIHPDDSAFDVLLAGGGFTGLSAVVLDGRAGNGTAQDVPDRLDRGTLQALGDTALATARALGDRDLRELNGSDGSDTTLVPVLGEPVSLTGTTSRALAVAALLAVAGLVWLLGRRRLTWTSRTAAGTALAAVPLVLGPLAVQGMWSLLAAVRPGYAGLADPWRPGLFRLAAVALVVAVVLAWYALVRWRIGAVAPALGGLVWLALLAGVLAVVEPGAAYLAAVPALAGAVAGAVCAATTGSGARVAAVLIGGAVAVVALAPAVALTFPAVGLADAAVPAFAATALAMVLLPAFELVFPDPDDVPLRAAVVPLAAAFVAGSCVLAGLQVVRFDADHPVLSRLAYAQDTDGQQAWWVSAARDGYTDGYVDRQGELTLDFPYLAGREVAFGAAQPAGLPGARVETVYDAVVGGRRELTVRVTPQRPGVQFLNLHLRVDGGTIARARVAGQPVPEASLGGDALEVTFHGPPADGVEAWFTLEGGAAASLRVVDGSHGLDGLPGHQPRPDGVGAAASPDADLVMVSGTTSLG